MSQVLHLRTFGAVYVADASGQPMAGAAAQRRLLALLAVLGAAGPAGMSRDRILGILWAESDTERARGALAQAMYHARRTLGCDELIAGRDDLRLNRDHITVDAWELEDAMSSGTADRVLEIHRGPFLDGFFLNGAPEFEQWAAEQRARYERQVASALDRLAATAESRGDFAAAVECRRRRAAIDPLDTLATVQLMTTLVAAGDRAGALQHARVHEVLLRDRLDVAPDASVRELVARVRADADAATAAVPATRPVPVHQLVRAETAEPVHAENVARSPILDEEGSRGDRSRPRRRAVRIGGALLAVAIVAGAVAIGHSTRGAPATLVAAPPAQPVVIAPFRVAGADAALAYLREGMVELLSVRLADDTLARAVDPGAVLGAWRSSGLVSQADAPRAATIRAAATLGASRVVIGSIVGSPAKLVITASVVGVPGGEAIANASVEGPADSISTLVDRIAVALLAVEAGEGENLAQHTTPSLPGLRAFLDGQAAYRGSDYPAAVQHYERALKADSSFALAALRLALAADRINDAEQNDRALAIAWGERAELSERDAAHLVAFAGPRYPAPSPATEQLAAWQRAVMLAPDRGEVWYELGERYFHDGAVMGVADAAARGRAALRRALELDPAHRRARRLLVLLAAHPGDTARLAELATPAALRDSMGPLAEFVQWRVALARGDHVALERLRGAMPAMSQANLRAIAIASQFDAVGVEDGERAIRRLRLGHTPRATEQLDALLAEHSLAVNEGRPVLAQDVTEQLEDLQPGWRAHLRLRLLDAIFADAGRGVADAAEDAAEELSVRLVRDAETSPVAEAIRLADACVVAQWRLARGEVRGVARIVGMLRAAPAPRVSVPIGANPLACAEIIDATLAVTTGQPDALQRVGRLDSLMLSGPAVGDASTYAHLVVARLYTRLGAPDRALAAIRRRPYMVGWPRYLATTRREEGRLALALGDRAQALTVLRQYLALREMPEDRLRREVDSLRAEVAQLEQAPQ